MAYTNQLLMRQNRQIILAQYPKCKICGQSAKLVHHIDKSKSNHSLSNLMAVCYKCHLKIHPYDPKNPKPKEVHISNTFTKYVKARQVGLLVHKLQRQITKEFLVALDKKNEELIKEAVLKLDRHKTRLTEL